ncbi:MAG TPA: hypothetical protein VHA13_00995 [Gammaproteobacteria bacterium]|nr:hypothetical protein [Gammaproteobacteria bacterium]
MIKWNPFWRLRETRHYWDARIIRSSLTQRLKDMWGVFFGEVEEPEQMKKEYVGKDSFGQSLYKVKSLSDTDLGLTDYLTLGFPRWFKYTTKHALGETRIILANLSQLPQLMSQSIGRFILGLMLGLIFTAGLIVRIAETALLAVITAGLYVAKAATAAALTTAFSFTAFLAHVFTAPTRLRLEKDINGLQVELDENNIEEPNKAPSTKTVDDLLKNSRAELLEITDTEVKQVESSEENNDNEHELAALILEWGGKARVRVNKENYAGVRALLQMNFFSATQALERKGQVVTLEKQLERLAPQKLA